MGIIYHLVDVIASPDSNIAGKKIDQSDVFTLTSTKVVNFLSRGF